jgi:hypothetical protein
MSLGCSKPSHTEPATTLDIGTTNAATPNAPPTDAVSASLTAPSPSPAAEPTAPPASASAAETESAPTAELEAIVPPLVDGDGNPLPQTEDRPSATSKSLQRRLELLVNAIESNDPDVALPAFFPVQAYAQVKAIAKPERDWERRLVAAFKRNIGEYHRRLGARAKDLRFVRLDVPEHKVQWMKPGREGNRLGYFRVLRSSLVLATAEDKEVALEVTSLISWRGEWYVVHLQGFE